MGSAFFNADGSIRSMSEIAGVLKKALSGMGAAQRSMALETIFGTDAIRAGNVFVKEGAEGIR